MKYIVNNGEISVGQVGISYITTSSTFLVGDLQRVALASAFETPAEEVIIGVTVPLIEE